jgi:hypothetical protein
MNDTRRFAFLAVTAMLVAASPCVAQDQNNGQATPDVSGTGAAGKIAVWKNSTTLTNSVISQSGGSVGIGTTAPVTKLEVNGNAQVDGNFSLSGNIVLTGVGPLIWADNSSRNLSAGLGGLPPNTTGTNNTAVGDSALNLNTTGSANTAVGYAGLIANTTGGSNAAIGTFALTSNTSGAFNTASGVAALYSNVSGSYNTASGNAALFYSAFGSNNIAIGALAGQNITTTSNNIEVGNQGTVTDSSTIRIGTEFSSGCTTCQTSAYIAGIYGSPTSLANVPVVVDSNGNLGTVSSSRRYKEDIHDMADASDALMQLRPVTFRYKKAYEDGSKPVQYGLIAEEVEQVYPDLVARSTDGQVESVRYQLLDPLLLNELQKQHATIAAQKEQIQSLEKRLARIEAMLTADASGAAGQ